MENAAYGLRVIACRGNILRSVRGMRVDLPDGDKRIDLTLIFRVIRKEPESGVTLVRKEIGRKAAPRIRFPKRRK